MKATSSQMACFLECPRKHWWRYVEGVVPVGVSAPLRLGRTVHLALEMLVKYGYASAVQAVHEYSIGNNQMRIQALNMLAEYDRLFYDDNRKYEVVKVEDVWSREIQLNNGETVELTGKADALYRDDEGLLIVEHKTTTRTDSEYLLEQWHRQQTVLYAWAMGANRVLHNTLRHSNLAIKTGESEWEFEQRKAEMKQPNRAKQKQPETDEQYKERHAATVEVVRNVITIDSIEVERMLEDVRAICELMLMHEFTDHVVSYRNTYNCRGKYGYPCPYYQLCSAKHPQLILDTSEEFEITGNIYTELDSEREEQE